MASNQRAPSRTPLLVRKDVVDPVARHRADAHARGQKERGHDASTQPMAGSDPTSADSPNSRSATAPENSATDPQSVYS